MSSLCLAESQSENEQVASETHDLCGASTTTDSGHAPTIDNCENSPGSPAHKASQGQPMERAETVNNNVITNSYLHFFLTVKGEDLLRFFVLSDYKYFCLLKKMFLCII